MQTFLLLLLGFRPKTTAFRDSPRTTSLLCGEPGARARARTVAWGGCPPRFWTARNAPQRLPVSGGATPLLSVRSKQAPRRGWEPRRDEQKRWMKGGDGWEGQFLSSSMFRVHPVTLLRCLLPGFAKCHPGQSAVGKTTDGSPLRHQLPRERD